MRRFAGVFLALLVAACGADSNVMCGTGAHLEGSACVLDSPGLVCGAGTIEQNGMCVETVRCGQGTSQQGDACVPADPIGDDPRPWYSIRIASTSIPADGISSVPVLAIGGTGSSPSNEQVLLSISRPLSGTLDSTALILSPFGTETTFRPCSSAEDPRCAGVTYISMSLASDPDVEVARTREFELVAPMGVASVAACELQTNALYFDGNGYIFNGTQLITASDATFDVSDLGASGVRINVNPQDRELGLWWTAEFEAPEGFELKEQVYANATRYPFNEANEAGIDVSGDGRGCNRIEGSFEVHTLRRDPDDGAIVEVLISFEQFCETDTSNVLRGCVKFTRRGTVFTSFRFDP